ncbi:MAG: Do family serine endopeptidase [Gammaproteobacteria bacterium]|nr:Do family serine endopeptidase [Gammaproteobacteria bacterium]
MNYAQLTISNPMTKAITSCTVKRESRQSLFITHKWQYLCLHVPLRVGVVLLALASIPMAAHIPSVGEGGRPSLAPVLNQVKDAVVNISVTTRQNYRITWWDDWGRLNPQRQYRDVQAAGSGVIIDAERGLVVTNHHVIAQAQKVVITLQDRRTFDARFLGSDPTTDIAVLQIEADDLTDLVLADSEVLQVGDFVVAIGNPFGLGQTVTSGIVSALGRNQVGIVNAEDFIQTDASINPGNSGGALIDIEGNLIGINTAIISPSGSSSGIGFAIPSNMVRTIAEQLIEYGDINRGQFGVRIEPVTQAVAEGLELSTNNGVVVTEVIPNSGADQAGMRIDDVIIAVNGKEITNSADLITTIALLRIGQQFDLTVIRNGREEQIEGVVQEFQKGNEILPGISVANMTSSHPYYGRIRGVVVSAVDSRLSQSNLVVDDLILEINRKSISNIRDLESIDLEDRPLFLRVLRGTTQFRLIVR